MQLRPVLTLLLSLGLFAAPGRAQVMISEFMAHNVLAFSDEDGDASDWIELHNTGSSTIDLGGMYLTDSAKDLTKWQFPNQSNLPGGSYTIVFASGKDRRVPTSFMHTNFALDSGGEFLALVAKDGKKVVSSFGKSYPPQVADVSYGFEWNPGPTKTEAYFPVPTPLAANGRGAPVFMSVDHGPKRPKAYEDIVVEAKLVVPPKQTLTSVSLFYHVLYFPEQKLAMRDDGKAPDRIANDGIFTTKIPSVAYLPGWLVRWRLTATSSAGSGRAPLFLSKVNSPEYFGTIVDHGVQSKLPVFELFARDSNKPFTPAGTRCSVMYRGEFYDNVYVRVRGGSSQGWTKKSLKVDFNKGYHFRFDPAYGRVEEINLNSTWSDKAYIRQVLAMNTYRDAGCPYSIAFPLRLEVSGVFHSVAVFIEQPDTEYLARQGLDPRGALYKMFNTCTSATLGVEKKTRRSENNSDLQALVSAIQGSGVTLERYLFDNLDIPAVLDYMAATILQEDNDHVHKNYYLYRDTEGDKEWQFLPWDKDLTFGRNYTTSGGVLNDSMWATTDPQSHPFYGDRNHRKVDGFWNRLIDACLRTPRIQKMFLRRLRTTMDEQLQPPSTKASELRYEKTIADLQARMAADVALDKAKWGIPSWGNLRLDFKQGLDQLRNQYLAPRRKHLYVTHSGPSGIIPDAQKPGVKVAFGEIVAEPASNRPKEAYVQVVNCEQTAVDVSAWSIAGGIDFRFPRGTVILPGESVWVAADVNAFRARTTGPGGNQGLLVVGPWTRKLGSSDRLVLRDAGLREVDQSGGIYYRFATSGKGDIDIQVRGAVKIPRLFVLFAMGTQQPVGCGPFLGLGNEAIASFLVPVNTHPFHVLADAQGNYHFAAPVNTIPQGVVLDSRVLAVDPTFTAVRLSSLRRTKF